MTLWIVFGVGGVLIGGLIVREIWDIFYGKGDVWPNHDD